MARTVSVNDFQKAQRGESDPPGDREVGTQDLVQRDPLSGAVVDANGRGPGFQAPAVPVADQLQALVLQDDISGMPLGQVVGLVRLAVAAQHVSATEPEIRDEAERRWNERAEADAHLGTGFLSDVDRKAELRAREQFAEQTADEELGYDAPPEPMMLELIQALGVQASCTAEMSLHMVTERVRQAVGHTFPEATDAEIVHEAERIWDGFSDQRKGPLGDTGLTRARIYDVDADGKVSDWRRPDTTPDRGPDVGTTVHTVSDDEPRFSGDGASDDLPFDQATFMVPRAAKFGTAPYLAAPELEEIAVRLMANKPDFDAHRDLNIVYRWKAKGGNAKGWPRLAGIERVSGQTLAFLAGPAPDLLVWLAADTLRDSAVTDLQVEAILFDQLAAIEWSDGDEDGDPTWRLVGPEIMCHLATLEEYGPFTRKLQAARPAFSQPGLFDVDDGIEDDEDDEDAKEAYEIGRGVFVQRDLAGSGVLIHADGTPLMDDEIAELERRELADDDDVALGDCSICGKPIEPGQVVSHLFTPEGEVCRHMACRYDAADSGASDEGEDVILADPAVI